MTGKLIWLSIAFLLHLAVSTNPCTRLKQDIEILENQKNRLNSEFSKITDNLLNFEKEKKLWEEKVFVLEATYARELQKTSGLEKSMNNLTEEIEKMKKGVEIQNNEKEDLNAKVKSADETIKMLEKVNSELSDEIAFMRNKLLNKMKNANTDNNSPIWQRILFLAAKNGDINEINFLVAKGININVRDDSTQHRTPLQIAAASGYAEVVEHLLNAGASLDQTSSSLNTALHEAALAGHLEVCQILLDRNAILESHNNNNDTPLKLAKKNGHQNIVDLLVKKGAEV